MRFFAPLSYKPMAALWGASMLVEFGGQIGSFGQRLGDAGIFGHSPRPSVDLRLQGDLRLRLGTAEAHTG